MCRTVYSVLSTVICGIQMLVRVFMTCILMLENVIRMVLQTMYNFISFMLQLISLVPICIVFILSSRLKCFMCGGGGPCPVNRGGTCDCLMSLLAIIIVFFIFRATGVLDKVFYSIGYAKAPKEVAKFVPTPGDLTECSRNETETITTTEEYFFYQYSSPEIPLICENFTDDDTYPLYDDETSSTPTTSSTSTTISSTIPDSLFRARADSQEDIEDEDDDTERRNISNFGRLMDRTTIQYYLI